MKQIMDFMAVRGGFRVTSAGEAVLTFSCSGAVDVAVYLPLAEAERISRLVVPEPQPDIPPVAPE